MKLLGSRRLFHCLACNQLLFIPPDEAGDGPFRESSIEPPASPDGEEGPR